MEKINLIYGKGDVLHTHVNINPFANDADGEKIIRGDISNLDKYVDDAELSELVAQDVIDYIPISETQKTLNNWISKIRIGGTIILGGVDLLESCKALSLRQIDTLEANFILHGTQEKPYLVRKSSFTCSELCDYIKENFDFKITKKRVESYSMVVEARRLS